MTLCNHTRSPAGTGAYTLFHKKKSKMKTKGIILVLLLALPLLGHSQDGKLRGRIEAMKVAFITEKTGLTPEQAQTFWPMYNEYQDAQKAIREKYSMNRNIEQLSDEALESQMLRSFDREQELLDLKKTYFEKMQSVISLRQIALLNLAEQEFNKEVLRRMMNLQQRRQRQNNNR